MKQLVGVTPTRRDFAVLCTAPAGPFGSVPLIQRCKLAKTRHNFSFWVETLLHVHSALAQAPQKSFQGKQSWIYLQHIIIYLRQPFWGEGKGRSELPTEDLKMSSVLSRYGHFNWRVYRGRRMWTQGGTLLVSMLSMCGVSVVQNPGTSHRTVSKLALLGSAPTLKAKPGKCLFICLFCSPELPQVIYFVFKSPYTHTCTLAFFLPQLRNANKLK